MSEEKESQQREISLVEFVNQVKADLLEEQQQSDDPLFYIDGVEIEVKVLAKVDENKGAGIKLTIPSLFSASANLSNARGESTTQTVKMILKPLFDKESLISELDDEKLKGMRENAKKAIMRGGSSSDDGRDKPLPAGMRRR